MVSHRALLVQSSGCMGAALRRDTAVMTCYLGRLCYSAQGDHTSQIHRKFYLSLHICLHHQCIMQMNEVPFNHIVTFQSKYIIYEIFSH